MAKRIIDSIVLIKGLPYLKCDNCGKLLPANREYFRPDYGNYYGIRRPCIKCQAEYDADKWLRYKKTKSKKKEQIMLEENRNKVLTNSGLPPIEKIEDEARKLEIENILNSHSSKYKTLVLQIKCFIDNGFIMDAARINMRFGCGRSVAARALADIKAGRYVK